jgi:hypothetical protein
MKNLFCIVTLLLSILANSQSTFSKGYIIDNSDNRIECYIELNNWVKYEYNYKLSQKGPLKPIKTSEIKEFGIHKKFKYTRHNVQINSEQQTSLEDLSRSKKPKLSQKTVFLESIVEGEASLFQYNKGKINNFYFKKNNDEIVLLIFKKYLIADNQIATNNRFQQQLFLNFKCTKQKRVNFKQITYSKNKLKKFFLNYNKCIDSNSTIFKRNDNKKFRYNASIRPRFILNSGSLDRKLQGATDIRFPLDIGNSFSLGLGAELEFYIYKNDLSVLLEPTFTTSPDLSGEYDNGLARRLNANLTLSTLELPFGIRYYVITKKTSKLYINTYLTGSINLGSELELTSYFNEKETLTNPNIPVFYSLGLGYKYSKFSLDLKYDFNRRFNYSDGYYANINSLSIIFGYQIF